MSKPLKIAAAVLGVIVLIIVAVFIYAAANLNSMIAQKRDLILSTASSSLGRKVEIAGIKASLGWGVVADLSDVKIADDPAISQAPFLQANDIYARVDLIPLLAKHLHVSEVILKQPQITIIRGKDGALNVATIGKKGEEKPPAANESAGEKKPGSGAAMLANLSVKSFTLDGGKIVYEDQQSGAAPVTVSDLDIKVRNFSFDGPFTVSLKAAALSDAQNIDVEGTAGPIINGGNLDTNLVPFDVKLDLGPLVIDKIRAIPQVAAAMPKEVTISEPVSIEAHASGTPQDVKFSAHADLTKNQIGYASLFAKPAGTTLKFDAAGSRSAQNLTVSEANLTIADLAAKASKIEISGSNLKARVDTNRFEIASLAKVIGPLQQYNATGQGEVHLDAQVADKKPSANGTITLTSVSMTRPGEKTAAISGLAGDIKLNGNSGDVGPLNFSLGGSPASLKAHANTISPIDASYQFNAENIRLADFVASRPPSDQIGKLAVSGAAHAGADGALDVTANTTSASGNVNGAAYSNLVANAEMVGKRVDAKSFSLNVFSGAVAGTGNAILDQGPAFNVTVNTQNIDLQQALESQKIKAAAMVRGALTSQIAVSGRGGDFEKIKPTLKGAGSADIKDGKLVGVNLAADALKKVDNIPLVGELIPSSIAAKHPELFKNPDTVFRDAKLTFSIEGPRITTNDLTVSTDDYSMRGNGWFDLDMKIDMTARALLSQTFSAEIIREKKNVAYLANDQGQIDVPLRITGALPKPAVSPDIQEMAGRAAKRAAQKQGEKLLEKVIPGGGGGKTSNPLEGLKGLFR